MLLGHNRCQQRNQRVAVDLGSVREDYRAAVAVAVKDDTEIRPGIHRRLAACLNRLAVFRIRDVIRECAVRLQIDAAGCVRAERLENLRGEKSRRAVAGVDDNMAARQRFIVILRLDCLFDICLHMFAVERDHIELLRRNPAGRHLARTDNRLRVFFAVLLRKLCRTCQNLRHIRLLRTAVLRKYLDAVPVKRQMAGRDHHRSIKIAAFQNR